MGAGKAPPLFTADFSELTEICKDVPVHLVSDAAFEVDITKPFMLKDSAAVTEWMNTPVVTVAMGNWGGQYSKQKRFKETKRAQVPMYAKEGQEETLAMFKSLFSLIPARHHVVRDTPFTSILNAVWTYGYDPKMQQVGITPNGLPMFKVLCAGTIRWLLFSMASLAPAMRTMMAKDKLTIEEITQKLANCSAQDLRTLSLSRVVPYTALQQPLQSIFVPAGWVVAEEVTRGVLVYGARKSFVLACDTNAAAYEELTGSVGEPAASKMKEALPFLSE